MNHLHLEGESSAMFVSHRVDDPARPSPSLAEYATHLARSGVQVLPGERGTIWTAYGTGAVMRQPAFHLALPTDGEVRRVLWHARALLASYIVEPDVDHRANAWLYICTDQQYALARVKRSKRGHVRTGMRELRIAPLTAEQLLAHGSAAYCETRRRLGLSGGTIEGFRAYVTSLARIPEYVFLGAWRQEQLAAFLTILRVDDWVDIQGTFSMDVLRQYRPNELLLYTTLRHYLVDCRGRLVFNGVSSLVEAGNAAGLHQFKTEVGFEALPVHRAFALHPLLRPLVNQMTLQVAWKGVTTAAHFMPANRRLRKTVGVLSSLFGDTHMFDVAAGGRARD